MLCSILYCIYFLKLSKEERKALELISTIGCSVSLIGVILTIMIYALFWKRLRRNSKSKVPSQVLMHLCVVIGMTDIFAILAGPALKYKVKLRENRKRTGLILSEGGGGGLLESFVEYCNEIT
jgi:Na+/melibiose symporter-like transporter